MEIIRIILASIIGLGLGIFMIWTSPVSLHASESKP